MKHFALFLTVLTGSMFLGCSEQVPPFTEGRAERYVPPQIQMTGPERENLRLMTSIDRPILTRDPADILHVTVPVRATSYEVLHVQYRVTFVDNNGQPLPGYPTGWLRQTLEPGGSVPMKFNSTSPRAQDFQMELRFAR